MLAFTVLALAASAAAAPIAALSTVEAALALPNTTQTNAVVYYNQNGNAGACGLYSQDTDLVVGLPTEFYNETGVVSSYCGTYLVVKSVQNNMTVTARVADASATNMTLSLSFATWNALNGTESKLESVQWRFANQTETAAAKKALGGSSSAPSSTAAPVVAASPEVASSLAAPKAEAPSTTAAAAQKQAETTQAYKAPETTTQAYVAPATTTTKAYVAPTTTTKAWTPEATQAAATQKSYSSASSGSYSGTATYFFQGGNPGNCGTVHSDSDYIVALTSSMYSGGSHCGQSVNICSTSTGRCVGAKVADSCPSCSSSGDLDLSEAAFNAIASPSDGVTPISWSFA